MGDYANTAYGGDGEELQVNRAEINQQQQQRQSQNRNVTILPVYQQYGTITVSNSVVSYPNAASAPIVDVPGASTSPNDFLAQGLSTGGSSTSFAGQQKTPNVYINGLPPHFPEEQLEALAAPFGEVKSVSLPTYRDSLSGKPKEFGFVKFMNVEVANAAMEDADGKEIEWRQVQLDCSQPGDGDGTHNTLADRMAACSDTPRHIHFS